MNFEYLLSKRNLWFGAFWEKWSNPYRLDVWISFGLFSVHFWETWREKIEFLFYHKLFSRKHHSYLYPKIPLVITTCRRSHLFKKTVESFFENCLDIDLISYIYIIDDNSRDNEYKEMCDVLSNTLKSKNLDIPVKYSHRRYDPGHYYSVMKMWNLQEEFIFFIEDDWLFHKPGNYIKDGLDIIFSSDIKLVCLRNAAQASDNETFTTPTNINYLVPKPTRNEWQGYTLNPNIQQLAWIKNNCGEFENVPFFENRYAEKCRRNGLKVGFLDEYIKHLGDRQTAYRLNCTSK